LNPADAPVMPGMLRKSTAFVPRYRKFESSSLQRRVCELSVPERRPTARETLAVEVLVTEDAPSPPQTASVGVSTTRFVRNEGAVIRHNMGWTFFLLAYLVLIGIACYFLFPGVMALSV
jgi:hypothetical protein